MNDLEGRVKALEVSQRRWKIATGGLLACLAVAVLSGAGSSDQEKVSRFDVVEARAFKIVDAKGNVQGNFYYNPAGDTSEFYLGMGRPERCYVALRSSKDLASVRVVAPDMGDRATMYVAPQSGGAVQAYQSTGQNQEKNLGGIGTK